MSVKKKKKIINNSKQYKNKKRDRNKQDLFMVRNLASKTED